MYKGRRVESNQHKSHKDDHYYDHPELLSVSFLKIGAMSENAPEKYSKIAAKDSAEP